MGLSEVAQHLSIGPIVHESNNHILKEQNLTIQHYTRFLAIISLAALTLAACAKAGTSTNNSNNTNTASNTASPKTSPTTATATGDYSTPTSAFRSFYEAAKATNMDGIKRSMSKKTLEELTKSAESQKQTLDDSLKEIVKDAPSNVPQMRNEKIDGEKATLEIKDDKMEKWNTVYMVKEDGQWKIAIRDESAAGMDGMDHPNTEKK